MSLFHLDPRQAGTGAAPDVRTEFYFGQWVAFPFPSDRRGGNGTGLGAGDSEQSALRAAREAAGFGEVAEQPCDDPVTTACYCDNPHVGMRDTNTCKACSRPIIPDATTPCDTCRWSRAAHTARGGEA